jgi:EpsD family peptidyl-prolyl cis-trans isomerase
VARLEDAGNVVATSSGCHLCVVVVAKNEVCMPICLGYIFRTSRSLLLITAISAAVAGCGKKSEDQASAPNGQIVARVGDQVVTTQELDTEFRWANVPNDRRRDPEVVKRVVGELVTRKYLLRQALAAKLDREPTVLLDVLRGREQLLANAFASRQISTRASAVSKADIDKFIANNPAKFADQQIMNVEQISILFNPSAQSAVDATKNLSSLDEVDQKLTAMGIPHGRSSGVLNSAEIPDELLKTIQAKKPDDVVFARAGQNGVFFQVKSKEPHPIEGDAAAALARQLLRIDMLKTEASMASISANIEAKYEGDYAKIMADQPVRPSSN